MYKVLKGFNTKSYSRAGVIFSSRETQVWELLINSYWALKNQRGNIFVIRKIKRLADRAIALYLFTYCRKKN